VACWVDSIQRDDLLAIWHSVGFSRDEQREISKLLTALPIRKIIVFGSAEEIFPAIIEAGKVPAVTELAFIKTETADEVLILELKEMSLVRDPVIKEIIHRWMCISPRILLGVDSTASWLRQIYQRASLALGDHLPPGILLSEQSLAEGFKKYFENNFTQVIESNPIDWLKKEVAGYHQDGKGRSESTPSTLIDHEPYIFLDSYGQSDSALFHGRRYDIRTLAELSISSQITVLYGPSGVGKTSLIGAGLLPLLAKNDIFGLQTRISIDSSWGLSSAQTNQPLSLINRWQPNMNFVDMLSNVSDTTDQLIVVVLDQIEALFTPVNPIITERFASSIKEAVTKISKPVHFVLTIREDYLAYLADLRPYLPRIIDRTYRLDPLNARQAFEAIVAPAEKCGHEFEPGLADMIIKHLIEGKQTIDPVDLQVVCYRLLTNIRDQGTKKFLIQDYKNLGGAESILADFLESVVAKDNCPAGTIEVLKGLTTSAGTKALLSKENLAQDVAMDVKDIEKVLSWLERPYRLVRVIQTSQGQIGVELRHDVLAKRILGWITDSREHDAKRVKDLLRMELQSHIRMGLIPSRAKFQQIDAESENPFLKLRKDELTLIIKAALRFSDQVEVWLSKLPETEQDKTLFEVLSDPEETVRRKAIALLPKGKSLAFLTSDLESSMEDERIQNLRTIAWLGEKMAWSVLDKHRLDSSRAVRSVAWSLLYELNHARATALKNAEQKRFMIVGGLATWLVVLTSKMITNGNVHIPLENWLIFMVVSVFLVEISLLADKIPRIFSRILVAGSLMTIFYLDARLWGLLLAMFVVAGIGANLPTGAAAILGFAPLVLPIWKGQEQVVWMLPFVLAVYALVALVWFPRHLLRRDRIVSWLLVGTGLFWACLSAFKLSAKFQIVVLVFLCGIAFGQVFERASILEDPHGTRYSYILNLIQKTWSLLHQRPAIFRSSLGWIVGSVWAIVLMSSGDLQLGSRDVIRILIVGLVYIVATWFSNAEWLGLILSVIAGSAIGFVLGGWFWMLGVWLLSCLYVTIVRTNLPLSSNLQSNILENTGW
jgi:hypothetical protein